MSKNHSSWYDSAGNRHIVYSVRTSQRLRDAGFQVLNDVEPWRGIRFLVRKHQHVDGITNDFIEGVTKQINDWNAQLLADPDKAKRFVQELRDSEFVKVPGTGVVKIQRRREEEDDLPT